ncbi:MAG: hypothetical protein ABWY45_16125 [Mycobacterium sp.]
MRLVGDSGLWSTAGPVTPPLLTAVLEVSGAVLSWPVDVAADPQVTFTDIGRADWLWRVIGEAGHVEVSTHARRDPVPGAVIDLPHLVIDSDAVAPLRRLALGHWLRRWWPASARDGIMALDPAVLDAELAVRTAAVGEFFTDETLDSDVESLLAPHAATLTFLGEDGDSRVTQLIRACVELADELGISPPPGSAATPVRSDYALAAGPPSRRPSAGVVVRGVSSISWAAVPAGVFDAAENTITWSIVATGAQPFAVISADTASVHGAAGIPVRLLSGAAAAAGALDDGGHAVLPLPMTESQAWDHDWSTIRVTVGADIAEAPQLRAQVRAIARARLAQPPADGYLAEILAGENDY